MIGDIVITDSVVLQAGQNLSKGAVLGRVKDTGKYKLSALKDSDGNNISDGSEVPCAVLLENVDATDVDKNAPVLVLGEVDANELVIDSSWSIETIKPELRKMSIFVKQSI
jgi:hypothetical protein